MASTQARQPKDGKQRSRKDVHRYKTDNKTQRETPVYQADAQAVRDYSNQNKSSEQIYAGMPGAGAQQFQQKSMPLPGINYTNSARRLKTKSRNKLEEDDALIKQGHLTLQSEEDCMKNLSLHVRHEGNAP